jgi:quercetin dioxygenase-like cupin family protein
MRHSTVLLLALALFWACSQPANENSEEDHSHDGGEPHTHSAEPAPATNAEIKPAEEVPATAVSPEYIQHAKNIEIVTNIRDAVESVGVMTHEGIFGPLLYAEKMRSFFIELQPGMFLSEHPHPTESMIYTVSGSWVLCSEGKRQVMEPGNVFHFGSNMPTGWEAPFGEPALLFVVKSTEEGESYGPYMQGLKDMAQDLDSQRKDGGIFYFNELPEDHAAIQFARSVNPDFDEVLAKKYE